MTSTSAAVRPKGAAKTGTEWLRIQAKLIGEGEELPVSTEVAATVEVEAWLQQRGVQYAPATQIPMNLIDEARSRGNQARREPIVAESVDRFAAAMRSGAVFPPIVVYADAGKLVIIDGNNRQAAARRVGASSILGFTISEETPSELVHLLTVEANSRHGVTPELAWRIQQAFGLAAMGWPDAQAAEAAGMALATFRTARSAQEADQLARALRVSGFGDLPASAKVALAAVRRDEAVFAHLARLAVGTSMTTDEIREVTRALKGLPSEAARLEYLAAAGKERAASRPVRNVGKGGPHSRLHSPRVALMAGVGKVLAINAGDLARQITTRHDRDMVLKRVEAARKQLALIEAALGSIALDED